MILQITEKGRSERAARLVLRGPAILYTAGVIMPFDREQQKTGLSRHPVLHIVEGMKALLVIITFVYRNRDIKSNSCVLGH